jgi:sugar phosphate isomerase/epimerase
MGNFILSAFADEIGDDLRLQMDVLEQHGIRHIEMRGVNGKGLVEHSLDEAREIKKQLDLRGFRISAVGSPIGKISITDNFEPHLELFRHTLGIAKIMEAPYIRMFSFYIPQDADPASHRDEVIRRWREFVREAAGSGITLLHENEKGIYGDTAERCRDLLRALDCGYVRATFDPANFVQCGVETYPHAFELLKDYIEYVHIKDALAGSYQVVPSGQGDGRVKDILMALKQQGFNGFLSIEPHLGSFTGLATLEPGTPGADLPEGGPRLFAVAVSALKKILMDI